MSTSTSSSNGTTLVTGPDVIQKSDFFVDAGILHPIIVGSIAVLALFFYLRLGSNRSIAPITVFDWLINVALGSTLAGIVNGNSLVRGLLALITMLGFQFITSHISSNYKQRFEWIFHAPPLVIAFRGEFLHKVMAKHRISESDVYMALRQQEYLDVCLVEAIIIEANGTFSIISKKTVSEHEGKPMSLIMVPAYRALCEEHDKKEAFTSNSDGSQRSQSEAKADLEKAVSNNRIAIENERPPGTGWNTKSVLPI